MLAQREEDIRRLPKTSEAELRQKVADQIETFLDDSARKTLFSWSEVFEQSDDWNWLLFMADDDVGIAFSLEETWATHPWAIVKGFRSGDPVADSYCPDLEDAVRVILYGGDIESLFDEKAISLTCPTTWFLR